MGKKNETKKVPFAVLRKGAVSFAMAGMMAFTPFIAGCSGAPGAKGDAGANGKSAYELAVENGFEGTLQEWLASLQGNNGTSSYTHIKYANVMPDDDSDILTEGTGDYLGIYVGTSATAPTSYSAYTWHKIKGEAGTSATAPTIEIVDGYWYVNNEPTGIVAEAKGIDDITSIYEYDYATNTEYYVFTFSYTDGTTEEKRIPIPKKIIAVNYSGQTQYSLCAAGEEPTLKVLVNYEDLTTEEVTLTEDMFIVDDTYEKPNFSARGTYNVKVSYRGITTTFDIKVVDPEYVVSIEYSGETTFDIVEAGQEPTIMIEATYEDGSTGEIEVTEDMFVVQNLFIKPDFTTAGTYQTQIKYQDATVNVFFTIVDPSAIESMEYFGNIQYSMVEAGNEPKLQMKVTFGDGRTETVDITDNMFVVDATHKKPNFQQAGLYNIKVVYQGAELEFAIRVVDPEKATAVAYSGKSIFTTDENPTIMVTITLEDSTTKEIEVGEDMYIEDSEHVKPDFSVSATYQVKIYYQDVTTDTLTFYVVDPVEGVLVASNEFVAGSYYDINKSDPTNKDKLTSGDYGKGKTFDKLLTTQDILVKIENADFSKQYNVTTSTFDSEGNYKGRGGIVQVYNGEIALKAATIGGTHFRLTTYIYYPFAAMPEGVKITIYKMPEKAENNIPEKEPEDVILSTEDFVYGTRYDTADINTTGSHIQCKASTSLIEKRDILIKVVSPGTDFTNYKVILSYHDESGAKTGKSDTIVMTNGQVEILASSLPASVAKIGITILDWGSGFTKIPEEAKIYVTKKPTTTSWEGKTISIIGDSISTGGYPSTLGSLTGATIDNNSVSGTNLAGNGGLVAQLPDIDENSDLIIVFGGTNDYWHKNVTIGTIDDEGTGTFYGSLKHILNYLQTNHGDAQYLFVFPFDQHFSGNQSTTDFGKGSLDDFRTAFINFCTVNNLEYVDLGTTEFDHNEHTSDGVHPNSAGHYIIAEAIKDAITNNFYN